MHHQWTFLIILHAIAASYALLFGAFNLIRKKKGDPLHRALGFTWIACMYFVCISSFWIQTITPGAFSPLHALSVFTIITVSLALFAAIRHNIDSHKKLMTGSYFGLIAAFIGVASVPTRLIPQLAIHDLLRFLAFSACIIISATLFIIAVISLIKQSRRMKKSPMEVRQRPD
jgi:uncharacterized membrane protein